MNGIEPQAIDVIVAEPHQRVIDHKPSNFVAVWSIEIERRPPGSVVLPAEVRPEFRQIVSRRAEVVVNDVKDDGETPVVAGVDQPLETIGPP